jgi:SAP domain
MIFKIKKYKITKMSVQLSKFVKENNITVSDLEALLKNMTVVATSSNVNSTSNDSYDKMTKVQLSELCKERGLKVSGIKSELVARLTATNSNSTTNSTTSSVAPKAKSSKKKTEPTVEDNKKALKVMKENAKIAAEKPSVVSLKRYENGLFLHEETGFVLNENHVVFGKLPKVNGIFTELDRNDIEQCNKFKLEYELPENLGENPEMIEKLEELSDTESHVSELVSDGEEIDEDVEL